MRIIKNASLPDGVMSAVSIGDFDGVHRGHAAILNTLTETAARQGLKSVVYTFDRCTKGRGSICSTEKRLQLFESSGVDCVCIAPFDIIKGMTAEDFVRNVLLRQLHVRTAVGCDIRFGLNARGDAALLESSGISVVQAHTVTCGGTAVSSTRIRDLIRQGDIAGANRLLGWQYEISGRVMHGHQNGRKFGFPTANLHFPPEFVVPAAGVYAAEVYVDGTCCGGICNIGVHPTVGAEAAPVAETHIFNFTDDIYGKNITVRLLGFIRAEKKFDSAAELTHQIGCDIAAARLMLCPEE